MKSSAHSILSDLRLESKNPLYDRQDTRVQRIAGPSCIVMFGITGDLARTKLLPAIYDLTHRGLLSPSFSLVGFGRRNWNPQQFSDFVKSDVRKHSRTGFDETVWQQLAAGLRFVSGNFDDDNAYERLKETLAEVDKTRGTLGNWVFYQSIPPNYFEIVCDKLSKHQLAKGNKGQFRRVVIEKPFGYNLDSARELNKIVEAVFEPDSIFRVDHYLGKETVQNILALRFANAIFEPVWDCNYVESVQITMAEDIGIGTRAGYYEGVGAARDVIQNHLLQLLAFTAMEEPNSYNSVDVRREKEKVLSAVIIPNDLGKASARGQYASGWQSGEYVKGFLEEEGLKPSSKTETYAAIKLGINTRRWENVPFYLRAGKRLGRRVTEIAVIFKRPPNLLFKTQNPDTIGHNTIVIRVQPDEGVTMRLASKIPVSHMEVRDVTMDFDYGLAFTESSPEAYERLILDMLLGEPPLFPQHREVELSWMILDPFEEYWTSLECQPEPYPPGSWGPSSANELMRRDGRTWRRP